MDRRKFIKSLSVGGLALAGATTASLALAGQIQTCTEDLEVTVTKIKINNLPAEFNNYRIGFISDQHLSTSVSEEFVDHSFKSLAKAGIDILILGGDYIYNPDNYVDLIFDVVRTARLSKLTNVERSFEVFKTIAQMANSVKPKDGVHAVYGNHDRWNHPTALEVVFREHQIPLLKNNLHFIARGDSSLLLIGVDDYMTGIPKLPSFERIPNQATILISHNPDFLGSIIYKKDPCVDLALCGHTHGGQIKLSWMGPIVKNIYLKQFFQGQAEANGVKVYTSRGIGTVFVPYRVGVRPEATVIELIS